MYTKMHVIDNIGEYWIILDPEGIAIASVNYGSHAESLLFHLNR